MAHMYSWSSGCGNLKFVILFVYTVREEVVQYVTYIRYNAHLRVGNTRTNNLCKTFKDANRIDYKAIPPKPKTPRISPFTMIYSLPVYYHVAYNKLSHKIIPNFPRYQNIITRFTTRRVIMRSK